MKEPKFKVGDILWCNLWDEYNKIIEIEDGKYIYQYGENLHNLRHHNDSCDLEKFEKTVRLLTPLELALM